MRLFFSSTLHIRITQTWTMKAYESSCKAVKNEFSFAVWKYCGISIEKSYQKRYFAKFSGLQNP
jgi:hypothetical protein